MAEARPTDRTLERALVAVGRDLAVPPAPALAPAVVARLEADRAARARPPFPRIAIWSRRRAFALAAIGVLALLALAFGARFMLGSAEVRVRPQATPSGSPLEPAELGERIALEDLDAEVGFAVAFPAGPPPDAGYAIRTTSGAGALLVWDVRERYPSIPGTPWGLALMEVVDDDEVIVKDVNRFEDLTEVEVGGQAGAWIDAPHQLLVFTEQGPESFLVEANVLIWTDGEITYRLETSLGLRAAIALAETIG
jgi:hypothetical protein